MIQDQNNTRPPETGLQRPLAGSRWRWNWTATLLTAYLLVQLGQQFAGHFFPAVNGLSSYFALSRKGLAHGYAWELLTYQFMHGGWMHLLFNSWAIWFFGNELERVLGGTRYLFLVFSSGIVGGVFHMLAAVLWPALFGGDVVGASACAFGLIAAFALMFPGEELTVLVFFFFPVRTDAMTLFLVLLVTALAGFVFPLGNIAHAAHLGGMAMGWFFVRKILISATPAGTAPPETA